MASRLRQNVSITLWMQSLLIWLLVLAVPAHCNGGEHGVCEADHHPTAGAT